MLQPFMTADDVKIDKPGITLWAAYGSGLPVEVKTVLVKEEIKSTYPGRGSPVGWNCWPYYQWIFSTKEEAIRYRIRRIKERKKELETELAILESELKPQEKDGGTP